MSWTCPICGVKNERNVLDLCLTYPEGNLLIFRCRCGMGYSEYAIRRLPADIYDESYYDHTRYTSESGRKAYIDHLAAFFKQATRRSDFSKKSCKLLDVGCATGDFVAWALNNGWDAIGIDIASSAVAIGKAKGLPLYEADIESLEAQSERYDIITLWDVLEHLPDTTRILTILRKALRPDGTFVLKTVSRTSLLDVLARIIYWMSAGKLQAPLKQMYVPGHLYYYTQETLRRHLKQEGWRIISECQSDTPAEALFCTPIMIAAFKAISLLQKELGHCYELMVACKKADPNILIRGE
jgi:2-polyprenyl-3-methyl-5-hydroxy-6-metoxy-1,4-benzoquinol methylase